MYLKNFIKEYFLILALFSVFFCLPSYGIQNVNELYNERMANDYFLGDPNQNEILAEGENYIIIRNITGLSKIYNKTLGLFEASQVFNILAESHCQKNEFFNQTYVGHSFPLNDSTAYFFCEKDLKDFLGEGSLFLSLCLELSPSDKFFMDLNCNVQIPKGLKLFPNAMEYFNNIKTHNKKYTDIKFITKLQKNLKLVLGKYYNDDLSNKRLTCSKIGFIDETREMTDCILKLIIYLQRD